MAGRVYPKIPKAYAVAMCRSLGASDANAAMRAVSAQPDAVMRCSIGWPLDTFSMLFPLMT